MAHRLHDGVAKRAWPGVVLTDRTHDQATLAVVANPIEPVLHDRPQPRHAARLLQRTNQDLLTESARTLFDDRQLQRLARSEMCEHAALGHASSQGQFTNREAFDAIATGNGIGPIQDQIARGGTLAGGGGGRHGPHNSTTVRFISTAACALATVPTRPFQAVRRNLNTNAASQMQSKTKKVANPAMNKDWDMRAGCAKLACTTSQWT